MASIWRCSYNSDHSSGVRLVNTFHTVVHDNSFVPGGPSADVVRDALHSALTTKYRALLPTNVTVQSLVIAEELAPGSTAVPEESAQAIGLAGTLVTAGDLLPVPTCALVTLYTNAAVRSGHGRMFIPACGPAAALDPAGKWDTTTTFWTALATFFDELKSSHTNGFFDTNFSAHTAIYSRTRRARGDAAYWFDVTSYSRRVSPHWLRSRLTAP